MRTQRFPMASSKLTTAPLSPTERFVKRTLDSDISAYLFVILFPLLILVLVLIDDLKILALAAIGGRPYAREADLGADFRPSANHRRGKLYGRERRVGHVTTAGSR